VAVAPSTIPISSAALSVYTTNRPQALKELSSILNAQPCHDFVHKCPPSAPALSDSSPVQSSPVETSEVYLTVHFITCSLIRPWAAGSGFSSAGRTRFANFFDHPASHWQGAEGCLSRNRAAEAWSWPVKNAWIYASVFPIHVCPGTS